MKISKLAITKSEDAGNSYTTAHAEVQFEDNEQGKKNVFIKTFSDTAQGFDANSNAFLVGCLVPALYYGEKRIIIEGAVCPMLKEGLNVAMGLLNHWYGDRFNPLRIEADTRSVEPSVGPVRAGLVMSGGMDSLAALRLNQLRYSIDHPARIKECFFLHGFDIGGVVERGMKYHVYERGVGAISNVLQGTGVNLVQVFTNIRHLCDERALWLDAFYASVLAAMAHAFEGRINMLSIGSSNEIAHLHPCASHPLLDPQYSSYGVRILHRDLEISRMEKIKVVSQWEPAFQNFRVCLANVPNDLNCGKCEKCVRTMIELEALGLLHKTKAFEADEVLPEDIAPFDIRIRLRPPYYIPLVPLLREKGRGDLADIIEKKLEGKS